ncbi:MAG TPA: hypothetical protein VID73_12675 [Ktedonobacterales bacterium]
MLASTFQAFIVPSAAQPSAVAAANAHNDQGVQSWQVGRRSEAMASFTAATRADANFAVPWHNLGAVYLMEGQFARAIPNFVRATQLAPAWALPRTHLAQAFLRAGDTTQALAASDAARALDHTLPDVRIDLRGLLEARLRVADALARRRLTRFFLNLAETTIITFATAGIGLPSLALPIYRLILYFEARRVRATTRRQLRNLDEGGPEPAARALPAPVAPGRPLPIPASGVYVSAGSLPPFSSAELENAPTGTAYRWWGALFLLLSVAAGAGAVVLLIMSATPASTQALQQQSFTPILEFTGALPLIVLGWFFCALSLLVGALAALRRYRLGWAVTILVVGGIGSVLLLVPGQLVALLYLVFMPHEPGKRSAEDIIPGPEINLR